MFGCLKFKKESKTFSAQEIERTYRQPVEKQSSEPQSLEPQSVAPQPTEEQKVKREYKTKRSLMTRTEKDFFAAIKLALPEGYILQPQVNLASVIKKVTEEPYCSELFRNIDFCVFDLDYKPIFLIEINDDSHKEWERRKRDMKVQRICDSAKISLITFWTEYGINQNYINKKISDTLVAYRWKNKKL